MKKTGWLIAAALTSVPLLAQVDGVPRPDRPRSGGGGIGIGISLPLGKKKPKDTTLTGPALEMHDAEIADYVAGQVLFFIRGDEAAAARIAKAAKVTIMEISPLNSLGEIMVLASIAPGENVEAAVTRLSAQKGVDSAQRNYQYQVLGSSREKGFALHGISVGAKSTVSGTIVMIDSPVDIGNAALKGAKITQTIYADDKNGAAHGTAIAEILVGTGNFSGVARGANLVSLAAFEPAGEKSWLSTTAKLSKALDDATLRSPQVVNMSFGGSAYDKKVGDFLIAMEKKGVCVVAAAGNNGGTVRYPARASSVIATTAVNGKQTAYSAASKGPEIDVSAWGVEINAAVPGGRRPVSGTSFAAAVVSGSLLRLHGCNGGRTPAATRSFLASVAQDLGAKGADSIYGAGLFRLKAKKKARSGGIPAFI